MRWNALSHNKALQVGAHLYVMESLYVPGSERPRYGVGDHFRLENEGYWHANAYIVDVASKKLIVEDVDTHTRYELKPAEKNEPHFSPPDVPHEEYTITR